MTNQQIYKKHLVNAPIILRETVDLLQLTILNLAMSGELADVNDQFEVNDELVFKNNDFRNISDYNVKLLYSLVDFIETKRAEIINVNALEDKDDLPF